MGLVFAFLAVALIYASVGFGGGSTYTAILALTGAPFQAIPVISLCCNLAVVSGSLFRFAKAGQLPWREAWPYLVLSIPVAYWMGTLSLAESSFLLILGIALILSAFAMVWPVPQKGHLLKPPGFLTRIGLGGVFGALAGLVGIGGGIFLAPSLYLLKAATPQHIAATASLFIAANSLAGLAGHLSRALSLQTVASHWPLLVAVVVGGQIGSWLTIKVMPQRWLKWATAGLVFYVGLRLLLQLSESSV